MLCPGTLLLQQKQTLEILTQVADVEAKSDREGIIALKLNIDNPIEFISVKASNGDEELIYKDIEIATFSGQISRMTV
jgi:hypothetical protein